MLRQAAEKTGDVVGDGTSTSTILAHAIYADGVRNVAAGASTIDIKRGLDRGLEAAIKALKDMPVAGRITSIPTPSGVALPGVLGGIFQVRTDANTKSKSDFARFF
jgi:chaperonin GroEL (HSP60 family)